MLEELSTKRDSWLWTGLIFSSRQESVDSVHFVHQWDDHWRQSDFCLASPTLRSSRILIERERSEAKDQDKLFQERTSWPGRGNCDSQILLFAQTDFQREEELVRPNRVIDPVADVLIDVDVDQLLMFSSFPRDASIEESDRVAFEFYFKQDGRFASIDIQRSTHGRKRIHERKGRVNTSNRKKNPSIQEAKCGIKR